MERIGLLLGSFDPVHRAHEALGRWALERVDRLWVVPTPGNPLKNNGPEAPWEDRLAMLRLAFDDPRVEICEIEKELPAPHYTINTIEYLQKRYPSVKFLIVCGGDIERELPRWHRSEELRARVDFLVYPRGDGKAQMQTEVWAENSTTIRIGAELEGLNPLVREYIEAHGLYYAAALNEAQAAFGAGRFGEVINLSAAHPSNEPLQALADMAREVLDFRHTDTYNP